MMVQATPPVGIFGKLPSHPDFVRYNAGGVLARSLDQWMQEGLSQMRVQMGNGWEEAFDNAAPLFFVYRDNDPGAALVGVCRPSRDQTGRRYPISIFANARLGRGGSGFHLLPQAYGRFLKAARDFLTGGGEEDPDPQRTATIMSLAGMVPQNLVEFQTCFDQYLRDTTMESFWQGLGSGSEDDRKYLIIKNLFAALVPRRGHDPVRIGVSLGLPTVPDPDVAAVQLAVWFLLCRALLGEKSVEQAVLFWHADSRAAGCTLLFRNPPPSALTSLLVPQWRSKTIWDVAEIGAGQADRARDALGETLAAALDNPGTVLRSFLKAIEA